MAPVNINDGQEQVIAKESVIVHDENLNIDRQIIAGDFVPPDLLDAYRAKVGEVATDDAASDEDAPAAEAAEEPAPSKPARRSRGAQREGGDA